MTMAAASSPSATSSDPSSHWLKRYYGARALVSILWVLLALTLGGSRPGVGALLLVVYPVWDGIANYVDAARNGGLRANPSQALNVVVSAAVAVGVAVTVGHDVHPAVGVIGLWASVSGLLQLSTGVRRWKSASAQWPQILSGGQSALAGIVFVVKALNPAVAVGVADVAGYVAVGALYYAISAGVLLFKR